LLCGSRYQAFGLTDTIAYKAVHQKGNIFQPRAQRWYPEDRSGYQWIAGPSLMSECAGAQDRADHTAGVTFRIRLL